jgi:hypothetical protein
MGLHKGYGAWFYFVKKSAKVTTFRGGTKVELAII